LRLHAPAKLFVEPLNRVRGSQRLPLGLGEAEEREEFVTAFPQARHHARAALTPLPLERRIREARGVGAVSVNDAMEVVADLGECMLRSFPLEVAELMDAAALHRRPRPYLAGGAAQPGIAVYDAEHRRA